MGTRNLTCVFKDGEYKVAQYGQWDGYPAGVGLEILTFLHEWANELAYELVNVDWITEEEREATWEGYGRSEDGYVEMHQYELWSEEYPELSRDTGGKILARIREFSPSERKPKLKLENSLSFAADSLFCEWAYVVDYDKGTFEVYEGFNKEALTPMERFFEFDNPKEEYRPVKLKKAYPLNALPSVEKFLEDCESVYEEE